MNVIEAAQQAEKYLEKLGSTPDEIAESLQDLGITGHLSNADHCVIANYLKSSLPDAGVDITVSPLNIAFLQQDASPGEHKVHYLDLPTELYTFIIRFDLDMYPELRTSNS